MSASTNGHLPTITDQDLAPFQAEVHRMVEHQATRTTARLVDGDMAAQDALEAFLEASKPPPVPFRESAAVLTSPFRYRPSFAGRLHCAGGERVWYGSLEESALLAEVAFYALFRVLDSAVDHPVTTIRARFSVPIMAQRWHDLTSESWPRELLADPCDARQSQAIAGQLRQLGAQGCCYPSARDPQRGRNVGVFRPEVFAGPVRDWTAWEVVADRDRVRLYRAAYPGRPWVFSVDDFAVNGQFPQPIS